MASTNQSPEYITAEKRFLLTTTSDEKLECLGEMLKYVPKHKAGEAMRANLRTRYKKLKQSIEKSKKAGKSKKQGIKKSEMQALLIGFPNTGKSSIFNTLTNQKAKIAQTPFTTCEPKLGTLNFEDVKIQLIDIQPFPNHDQGLINSTDTLLITIDNLNQIEKSLESLKKSKAKKIFIFNKTDLLDEKEKRKIKETLKTKKLDHFFFSAVNPQNTEELKQKIFQSFPIIRVYTKEPHKQVTKNPLILEQNSTVADVAEKILHGMSKKIKKAKIWGPSSKFAGQPVGLEHVLKDKDTLEMQIK